MGKIISLNNPTETEESHCTGEAICMLCGHKWVAVAPVGVMWFECSECHSMKGHMIYDYVRKDEMEWQCGCGNDLFKVTPNGYFCPNCGEWQTGF